MAKSASRAKQVDSSGQNTRGANLYKPIGRDWSRPEGDATLDQLALRGLRGPLGQE